jgi:hypothetical protein
MTRAMLVTTMALWAGAASAQETADGPPAEAAPAEAPERAEAAEEAPVASEAPVAPVAEVPVPVAAPAIPLAVEPASPEISSGGPTPGVAAAPEATPEATPEAEDQTPGLPPRLLRYALSLEAGTLQNQDPSYDLFANGDVMGSIGLSAGYRLTKNIALVGSWQRVGRGAVVSVQVPDEDADFESRDQQLRAALLANQLTAGVRLDFAIAGYLRPYVSGQGMAVLTRVRLDDEPDVRDNPGQVEALGTATGGLLTFGAELRAPLTDRLHPAVYLEMGPSWLTVAQLGELGSMQMGGFALRTGVGLRF